MPGQNFGPLRPFKAAADLSALQDTAVQLGTNGIAAPSGAGVRCIGLLTDAPKSGEFGSVQTSQGGKWVAGGTFSRGASLTTDAQGRAISATTGQYILAVAVDAATAVGQKVSVEIVHAGVA